MADKLRFFRIQGTGFDLRLKAKEYELRGLPAGTYHIFTLPDGTIFRMNDFNVRSVTDADSEEKLIF